VTFFGFRRWAAERKLRAARRAVKEMKATAIAALREGELAKVTGVVSSRDPLLTSAVGRQACVGYSVIVETRGIIVEPWRLLAERKTCATFSIADDSGTAVVEGPFLLALEPDDAAWANLPVSVHALLWEELGKIASAYTGGENELHFQEALLMPGDRVSVVGCAAMEIDPAGRGSYRDPPMLFHIRGSEDEPVVIADEEE
jgi:hypothetical protein